MQSNTHLHSWLVQRGITPDVLEQFKISVYDHPQIGDCIRIPISETHAKYRRDPQDPRKPKYLYDAGGKVTLYGAEHITGYVKIHSFPDGQSVGFTDFDKIPKSVVITEGELDTLVLWSQNIPAVSSTGGAMSWQEEWSTLLTNYDVYIALDNDDAGANGTIKILKTLPTAKIILIPEIQNVKDISDYVSRGGNFRSLMASALTNDPQLIEEDKARRDGMMLSTRFHDLYLDAHYQELHKNTYTPPTYDGDDEKLRAKSYPLEYLIDFKRRKALCPFHNESTPSLQYYPKTNSAYCFGQCGRAYDPIDVYMLQHGVGFKEALKGLNKMV